MKTLPDGINDTYTDAWDRVCAQRPYHAALGKNIFLWVLHAARPLKVEELRCALAIEEDDDELNVEGLLEPASLAIYCGGLVVIDSQSDQVSLVHPTAQEYFEHQMADLFPAAHDSIAASCITYLRMKPFRDEGALDEIEAFRERTQAHHLLGYAAVNWGIHVRKGDDIRTTRLALALLAHRPTRLAAWQALTLDTLGVNSVCYGPE